MAVRCEAYTPGRNAWKLVRVIPDGDKMLLSPNKQRSYEVEAGDRVAQFFRLPDSSSIPSGSDNRTRIKVLGEGESYGIGNYRFTTFK